MSTPTSNKTYTLHDIIRNSDGSVTIPDVFFATVPPSTADSSSPSLSKDVLLNSEKNTSVRIFLPKSDPFCSSTMKDKKLPILVYIHGGGFILASPAYPVFHQFCCEAASHLGALVISVKYRLAPEHRLPAAYDDVLEALAWIKDGKDEWIRDYGNLSNCGIMGESAGGNIAYHAGLKAAAMINDYKPIIIKGLVLIQPFFGGLERSESESRGNDPVVPLQAADLFWDLSLPVGVDRSHEYCDPTAGGGSSLIDEVRELGWWVAVVACEGDLLVDRDVKLAKLLEKKGVNVKSLVEEGGMHGMFVGDHSKRKEFLDYVLGFWP